MGFYLGMERVGYAGRPADFEWLDGASVGDTYNNFAAGEPNNYQGKENCGVFFSIDGFWRSELCSLKRRYVCQRLAGAS